MSHLKGIAFESDEVQLQKLRDRLRQMSDEELIKFGNRFVRALSAPRVSVTPDPWKAQLKEAREEWRNETLGTGGCPWGVELETLPDLWGNERVSARPKEQEALLSRTFKKSLKDCLRQLRQSSS